MSVLSDKNKIGVLDYNHENIPNIIKKYSSKVDLFIVIPHWGREYIDYPSLRQRYMAHKWIDCGADLIVGHHPHIIQGKEIYKGKSIYYSLGNYIFPDSYNKNGVRHKWKKNNNESIMIKLDLDNNKINIGELGLFFNKKENKLESSENALNQFQIKSKFLDFENYPTKKYFGLWQNNYYNRLKYEYSYTSFFKRQFPFHKKYGVIGYVLFRFYNKYLKK